MTNMTLEEVEATFGSAMNDNEEVDMEEMVEVMERRGDFAHGGHPLEAAQEWVSQGFTPEDADAWLDSRCFCPHAARRMVNAGLTPDDAAQPYDGAFIGTLGEAVANGDVAI